MITALMRVTGLSKLSLGIIAIVLIIAAAGLIYSLSARSQDKRVNEAAMRGVATERAATAAGQVSRAETANKAEAEVRAEPEKRREICSKYSRTPENCT